MKQMLSLLTLTFISLPAFVPPPQPPKGKKLPTFEQMIQQGEQKKQQEERKRLREQERERQAQEKATKEGALQMLPADVRLEIIKVLTGENIHQVLPNLKRYYLAHPAAQKSVDTTKAILNYLMENLTITEVSDLQRYVDALKKLPTMTVFNDPEMQRWIKEQTERLGKQEMFFYALRERNIKQIKHLLAEGVPVNSRDAFGGTALMVMFPWLAHYSNTAQHVQQANEIVSILLDAGVNPNIATKRGETPLYRILLEMKVSASRSELKKILIKLLEKGADPNTPFKERYTPNTALIMPKEYILRSLSFSNDEKAELMELLRKHGLRE